MAQALYAGHPVQEYLREEAGEDDALHHYFPGIHHSFDETIYPLPQWDLRFLSPLICAISVTAREDQRHRKAAEEFAEVFKYKLVSSALLSIGRYPGTASPTPSPNPSGFLNLMSTHRLTPSRRAEVPGRWNKSVPVIVEDEEEDDESSSEDLSFVTLFRLVTPYYHSWSQTLPPFPLICLVVLVVLKFPFILAPFLVLLLPFLSIHTLETSSPDLEETSYADTLHTLDSLIQASQVWDQTTTNAISLLPSSPFSTSPLTPPLAHSLHATLAQTSTHVGTIRSLLSALARSPRELQMLERMYGPTSPAFGSSFLDRGKGPSRRDSLRTPNSALSPSAPYRSLSPRRPSSVAGHEGIFTVADHDSKSRNRMSSFTPGSRSPMPAIKKLTALNRSSSVSSFNISTTTIREDEAHTAPSSPLTRFTSRRRSISKPSSLTNVRNSFDRDSLSPSTLSQFREQAKGTIRHTAGCLLGLRFMATSSTLEGGLVPSPERPRLGRKSSSTSFASSEEREDDFVDAFEDEEEEKSDPSYWEDVRSVLGLFRSALEDASDRLLEAITDHQRGASALPSPPPSSPPELHPPQIDLPPRDGQTTDLLAMLKRRSVGGLGMGFAPAPSHLGMLLKHVESMQDALREAELSLQETLEHLPEKEKRASVAYEHVRSALGVALRECERGRTPLMDYIRPPPQSIPEEESPTPPLVEEEEEDVDDEERSSAGDCISPTAQKYDSPSAMIIEGGSMMDDSKGPSLQALLAEALLAIPPSGKEQVFEGSTDDDPNHHHPFRDRPNLSRAERIAQVKARRGEPPPPSPAINGMGPGTDVVQELKDVIWQVGEKRRRSGMSASDVEEPARPPGLTGASSSSRPMSFPS